MLEGDLKLDSKWVCLAIEVPEMLPWGARGNTKVFLLSYFQHL